MSHVTRAAGSISQIAASARRQAVKRQQRAGCAGPISGACAVEPSPCRGVHATQDDAERDRVQARHRTPRQQQRFLRISAHANRKTVRRARCVCARAALEVKPASRGARCPLARPISQRIDPPKPPVGGRRNGSRAYRKRVRLRRRSGDHPSVIRAPRASRLRAHLPSAVQSAEGGGQGRRHRRRSDSSRRRR